jgi:DNA invertase Pin-like site-specific DNA recombinase
MRGKFVSYLRVSTGKQGADGLGIEAQRAAVTVYLNGGNWQLLGEFVEVESGKRSDRPKLAEALALCKKHRAKLIIAKLDRLSRSVAFLATLMERGVEFVACDNPHANKLTVHILAAMAEHEREQIGLRTRNALAAAKARGTTRDGRPLVLGNAALAAANKAAAIERAKALAPIFAELDGKSANEIARVLNARNVATPTGKRWSSMTVIRARERIAQ